jgi:mannosyltransferase
MTLVLHRPDVSRAAVRPGSGRRWLPAAGPGLVMLVLALIGATRPVLSWDEIATADAAHRSAAQIWHLVHHVDAVFGVYYLALHYWTALFGDSVLSLRLPSILAMAAAAALTGELGRRLFGARVGVLAGLLLCLVPNMSRYAAEARPYALVCFFSVLALVLLFQARWLAYAAAIVGVGLCSLVALTALAGHLVLVLSWHRRRLPWCAAVLSTLVIVSPLIWWGLHQRQAQLHWVPPMTLGSVYGFPGRLTGSPEVAWLLIGLLVTAAVRPTRRIAEMAAAALLPIAVVCAVSFAGPSFWINRYLLFCLAPAVIVAAAGLVRLSGRTPGLVVALAVFAAAALPGQIAVRQPTVKNGSGYRTLAAVIRHDQQPGDDIVFQRGRTMRAGLDYYLRHDAGRPRDVLQQRTAAQTATLRAKEYTDPDVRLAAAGRIWLIAYGRRADPATGRPDLAGLLRDQFQRAGLWTVKRGTMALYIRRGRP